MDNRGGGGGGRTPRGKKFRGSPRGRGQGQGQDSPRTPAATFPSVSSPHVQQSPTISSSALTPSVSTPGPHGLEESVQVRTPIVSTPVTKPPPISTPTVEVPPPPKEKFEIKTKPKMDSSGEQQISVDVFDKSQISEVSSSIPATPPTPKEPPVADKRKDSITSSKELQPPELPADHPHLEKLETTESKVSEALAKAQPRPTAKTLVVSPPEIENVTGAPLTVNIENLQPSLEDSGARPSTSGSQPVRSGTGSPAYAYSLRGPVGKPGYIGGVGFSDEEGDSPDGQGKKRSKSEGAIAAVETAVKGFTKRQWILLLVFGLIDLLSAITVSLQAPFFPGEAERKGASASEYGFVFGIFEFTVFLTSPLYGKYMNQLGPKTVFNVGILVTSVAVICFGLLDRIDDHTTFISLCFVCRVFEALGCAGFFTATFTIIACEFPESVATTFASLETFFGLGLIVGPTVGGALYGIGGFPLPFFVVGGSLLLSAFVCSFLMPKIDKATDDNGREHVGYGVWTILKFPSVALAAISIAATSMSLGFVSATLEPHIRSFALTPLQTGLVFVVNGGVYALTAPIWGFICDWLNRPIYVTILGNVFIFVSFLLIGPASFIPFDTILWVTITGLVLQGLGFGCCLVAGFIVGLKDSMKNGLPDNMATYSVASGLWTMMISFGAFVGPSVAGVLYDTVGFRDGSYLILATSLIVGMTILIHTISTRNTASASDSESQPLLRQISPLLGRKDVEADPKSSTYGSTSGTGEGNVTV